MKDSVDQTGEMVVVAIDIDGTALEHPDKVNDLYHKKNTVIILHTARPEIIRQKTVNELNEKGIKYNALVMDKLKADIYIDDKNAGFDLEKFGL